MSPPPRYQRIKQFLLQRIRSGTYPPHFQILPEERLAAKFGVSRMTANKAIRDLVQEGFLMRRPGVGTFVTDLKAESSLLEIHNIADEVANRDHDYSNTLICREAITADEEVALRLEVPAGTHVFHTILVHRENDTPIQLEDRYVNPEWVPHYLDTDFSQHTPNKVLVAACPISELEHVVEAVLPDKAIAGQLKITIAEPCLRMIRRTWSNDNLISYARLTYPGDRYKLRSCSQSPRRR